MNIDLTRDEVLFVLDALYDKYLGTKAYFAQHTAQEEILGMSTPEELKDVYNSFLGQVQAYGEYKFLDKIK